MSARDEAMADALADSMSEAEADRIRGLLEDDPALRAEAADLVRVHRLLRFVHHQKQVPSDMVESVRSRIESYENDRVRFERAVRKRLDGLEPAGVRSRLRWNVWIPVAACLAIAAGAVWVSLRRSDTASAAVAGTLARATRVVYIERQGTTIVAGRDVPVMAGDIVKTRADATAEIVYREDDSRVTLLSDTNARFFTEDGAKRLDLDGGTITCAVAGQPREKDMVITTPHTTIQVKGTAFTLTSEEGGTRLEVDDGLVHLTRRSDGAAVEVAAGQYVIVAEGAELAAKAIAEAPPPRPTVDETTMSLPGFAGDSPQQAALRRELRGKGYVYVPRWSALYAVDADGSDLRLLQDFGKWRQIWWAQASWDGRQVAVTVNLPPRLGGPGEEVWLVEHDGSDAKMIFRHLHPPAGWLTRLHPVWAPGDRWIVISHGNRVDAVHRETGEVKRLLTAEKGSITNLTADREGRCYFWPADLKPEANAFSVDGNGNIVRGFFKSPCKIHCDPKISPDGARLIRYAHQRTWELKPTRTQIIERLGEKWDRWRFVPTIEFDEANRRGDHQEQFWSPDSAYVGFRFDVGRDEVDEVGYKAVVAVCRYEGGPAVRLLADTRIRFGTPTWGPVPEPPDFEEEVAAVTE